VEAVDKVYRRNRPMPELLRREDGAHTGGWVVRNVQPVRGEPYVNISQREMAVPLGDGDLAKAIRMHELVHTKLSPPDWSSYITDVTPLDSLQAAEEVRVNFVAAELGAPLKAMGMGADRDAGELVAKSGDWRSAVLGVAASVHTGSLNHFITGVRSVDTGWADSLRDLSKEIVAFQKQQLRTLRKNNYNSDDVALAAYCATTTSDKFLDGMVFTIELAMLLESAAAMPAPTTGVKRSRRKADGESTAEKSKSTDEELPIPDGSVPTEAKELRKEKAKFNRDDLQVKAQKILRDRISQGGLHDWEAIVLGSVERTRSLPGALTRRKVPAVYGRQIKRMDRLYTDPKKRIFERRLPVHGGVVLIDCSGSMKLSTSDVYEILLAAPGCTVVGYGQGPSGQHNAFVLASGGKMVDKLPKFFGGNGCDLPALKFALSKRGSRRDPVVWVTDGMVYRPGSYGEYAQRECALAVRANDVHMVYSPAAAVSALKQLKGGGLKPKLIPRWESLI